jgi:hypothetical protein
MASCPLGYDGWLMWTWDTLEQPEFWTAIHEEGAIAAALSPIVRPDPCSVGTLDLALELAAGATAMASTAGGAGPPGNVLDGIPDTAWSAGTDAPQWIQVDLGAAATVEAVRLLVAQDPAGPTTHVVTLRDEAGATLATYTLAAATSDGDWLEPDLGGPLGGVRFVRIDTTASPSWVAWREVSILGSPEEP